MDISECETTEDVFNVLKPEYEQSKRLLKAYINRKASADDVFPTYRLFLKHTDEIISRIAQLKSALEYESSVYKEWDYVEKTLKFWKRRLIHGQVW